MALPKLKYPTYTVTLPVSKQEVKFRPFTVGEMKTLVLQASTGKSDDIIFDTVEECTIGKKPVMGLADTEWLFLQIRAKAVGEVLDLRHKCTHCGEKNPVTMNLETDVYVDGLDEVMESIITVADNVQLVLQEPSRALVSRLYEKKKATDLLKMIGDMISSVTSDGNTVVREDTTEEERIELVESLSQADFNLLEKWFMSRPTLKSTITYTCAHCGEKNELSITGTESFFT